MRFWVRVLLAAGSGLVAGLAVGGAFYLLFTGLRKDPVAVEPSPAKAITIVMCKAVYGVLLTYSDGTVYLVQSPTDPRLGEALKRLPKGPDVLTVIPEHGCPIVT